MNSETRMDILLEQWTPVMRQVEEQQPIRAVLLESKQRVPYERKTNADLATIGQGWKDECRAVDRQLASRSRNRLDR